MNEVTTVQTAERKPQTHSGYRQCGMSVLPIGPVKLSNASNAMFGTVWNCWKPDTGTLFLLEQGGKFKVVYTSGVMESIWVDDYMVLKHDQTCRTYPGAYRIVTKVAYNQAGLDHIRQESGKGSIIFYTFK